MTNNPPIPPRPPAVAKYLEHRFRPAITKGSGGTGRLIFALDTTASRQLTWDTAYALQNTMFDAVAGLGGLFAQLVYSRGYDECEASKWLFRAAELHRVMRAMSCVGGETQIERVLSHAIRETGKNRGGAVVFVGDAMEEKVDRLGRLAVELGPLRPSSSTKAATRPPRQHSSKLPPSQGCLLAVRSCRHSSAQGIARGICGLCGRRPLGAQSARREKGGEILRLSHQLERP
jgi:hypothetical protein